MVVSKSIFSAKGIMACIGNSYCRYLSCPKMALSPILANDFYYSKGKTLPGVAATMSVDKSEVVICLGRSGVNVFKGNPNTDVIAIKLDFRWILPCQSLGRVQEFM